MIMMNKKNIGEVIYCEEDIKKRIRGIANSINRDFKDKELLSVGRFQTTEGPREKVKITKDLDLSIRNRDIIVVEDIIRTGLTHSYILKNLEPRRPKSINLCVFLDCKDQRLVDLPIKYSGFDMDDRFVIGYGLDYKEKYRNLTFVAEFEE